MPKKQINELPHRDPIANVGQFEPGDGDIMMRRSRRNFGPDDIDQQSESKQIPNTNLLKQIYDLELKNIYGKKYAERNEEPTMYELMSGGLEVPHEYDYKKPCFKRGDKPLARKNQIQSYSPEREDDAPPRKLTMKDIVKKDLIHRINKSESQYVSEIQDNYRKYAYDRVLDTFLFDHLQNPEKRNGKKPVEIEPWMMSQYQKDYIDRMRRQAEADNQLHPDFEREISEDKENQPKLNKDKSSGKVSKQKSKDDTATKRQPKKNTQKENDKKRAQSMSWKDQMLKRSSQANRQERIDELHKWARWLPDSAYQSYFGKPAWHAYGKNNTNPTVGGHVYGQYMLSHNVNPEHGENNPKYQQVYKSAMNYGFRKGDRVPVLSRKGHENLEITPSELAKAMKRNPIMPKKYEEPDGEEMYAERDEKEYDFSHLKNKKKNKNGEKIDFHPKEEEPEEEDDQNEGEGNAEDEAYEEGEGEVSHPNRSSASPTPEPGTLEYKRMLEQFANNPEYVRMAMQEGNDLQNMFPFCSVHNSYGQQLPTHELDPRNYKFLPANYTKRIAPAGKVTSKCDNLYRVILPDE